MAGTRADAEAFARRWRGRGNEEQDKHKFWIGLFQDVLGLEDALDRLEFEQPIVTDSGSKNPGFIDVLIPSARVLVEQKSYGTSLDKRELRQGREVTPAEQGLGYAQGMPLNQQPRYIIACNFSEMRVYDRNRDSLCRKPLFSLALEDLPKNLAAIDFLTGGHEAPESLQQAVSVKAGEIMGRIHNLVATKYVDPDAPESHHALSVFCTRVMFLMYCEDAGLRGPDGRVMPNAFRDYLQHYQADDLRDALLKLFEWLDTPDDKRSPYAPEALKAFPYMDGGLFSERTEIPALDETIRTTIIVDGCQEFDWTNVNPTVFGSIFEGALSHDARRSGGMHYTSPENIHKVIDPLFLDALKAELGQILERPVAGGARTKALRDFQDKLGGLTFLDPACGSGNFLTETYMCLRRLENKVLFELSKDDQSVFIFEDVEKSPVRVSLSHFHGIEINDFACCVARTALWIAEKQADQDTAKVVMRVYDELPLTDYAGIVEGNALRMDWNDVVPASECDYIMGNPPFIGHISRMKNPTLGEDIQNVWGTNQDIDYVSCWYKKAATFLGSKTGSTFAFVSTNSITQGRQPSIIFPSLFDDGWRISFAHRTFVWNSQADDQAHVHVVIIGMDKKINCNRPVTLYSYSATESEPIASRVKNINAYLLDGPNVFVEPRSNKVGPISSDLPIVNAGSMANDGGYLLLSSVEEYEKALNDPVASKYLRPFLMGDEFINGGKRWCFWLSDAPMSDVMKSPILKKRVEKVRQLRLASSRKSTREKLSQTPQLFGENHQPTKDYLAIPRVFSEHRRWTTCAHLTPETIAGDKVYTCDDADGFAFSIIESSMFLAWQKAVGGRLKSDPSFSNTIVWNNIPLPTVPPELKIAICNAGRQVIDVRTTFPNETLASLYSPVGMHPELIRAHEYLDTLVDKAFGLSQPAKDEAERLTLLFKLYAEKTKGE